MENYRYVIIGGGIAGITAAETIRQRDTEGSIAVVSDEVHPLYSRVMLSKPNFFLGEIPFEKIWLKSQDWYDKNRIKFIGGKKAVSFDAAGKALSLSDGSSVKYEKLLLATGVYTRKWEVPGAEKKNIFSLKTLEDGKNVIEAIKGKTYGITIGGGFIGFEMADMLHLAGMNVSMILRERYFWKPLLDEASGRMIEDALKKAGIKIYYEAEAKQVLGGEVVEGLVLKDDTNLPCQIIVCGIGTYCDLDWLTKLGVKTNRGIIANEYLETGIADVWTAGDCAEFRDLMLDETIQLGNWVNAREQGRIAGLNMTGKKELFKFVSFYTTQGVGISIAFVGDVRPILNRLIIPRGSPESGSYGRIIVLDRGGGRKEVEGATLINRTGDMGTISKLIESNMDVSGKLMELGDPSFDLKTLLAK